LANRALSWQLIMLYSAVKIIAAPIFPADLKTMAEGRAA
jgi:hypothetical protein